MEHRIEFVEVGLGADGRPVVKSRRFIRQSDVMRCPFCILDPSHYREDGSCKCDDPEERKRMIREWGYSEEDFAGIPLREE